MNYDELTYKHLSKLSDSIANAIESKGLINSGDVIRSLEIKGNKLLANDYIYYLDQGRGPGKYPPMMSLRQWVMNKLGVEPDEVNSIAYLISRKIARDGTDIFRNSAKGIQLDILVDAMLEEITKELPEVAAAEALKWL